jgi:phage gp36-like protein
MYLTVAEFIERYTEREAVLLTAEPGAGAVVNAARLERGLSDASAEVDSYLSRRFVLPLLNAATMQPVVPDMIKRLTGDVARYLLTGTHVRETEAIRNRYKDAVAMLVAIADGRATPGVELALASSPSAPAGGSSAVRSGARTFGDSAWSGY